LGTEFEILLEMPEKQLEDSCLPKIARGIINARTGNVCVLPGYDGQYGKVEMLKGALETKEKQMELF